ncbi:response regulator [Bradyrhizobium sp. UFLA05-153]
MVGSVSTSPAWLAGGGEMGARMRAKDWTATPLGPPETWSQSVQAAVSICLNSRFPIVLWIGPELRIFYNDTYIPFLGVTKHPAALGAPGLEVWGEIWTSIGPMHEEVAAGRATSVEDQQMFFARQLPREEVYVTFGYSPILAPDGIMVEGVFCACTETTAKVIGERRLATLRDLAAHSSRQRTAEIACVDAVDVLRGNPLDIPFAAIYVLEEEGTHARRLAGTGLDGGWPIFPETISVIGGSSTDGPWPLSRVAETGRPCELFDLPGTIGILRAGQWSEPVETAIILPLAAPPQTRPAGFLIVGASPRRIMDADYRSFFDLVAGHIATSIADARAFEVERKRAEALAEIDRAKAAFFSNVSHEFRTPLTLMMGPIEELLAEPDTALSPEHRAQLDVAHRNSLRLLRLVNTLLDFSRVEAGRMQANYQPVELSDLTAELASNFRSACERAGLALGIECQPLGQPVYVDREMWEKIVLNVISNAFKFTLEGRIAVTIEAESSNAVLRVADTGVGIPEQDLRRIFERFHRIEGRRGRTHEGTGIGLALVQELVRLHGGEIRVESQVGRGTTFSIRLPFGRDHLPANRIQAQSSPASTAVAAGVFVEEAMRWLPSAQPSDNSDAIIGEPGPGEPGGRRARVLVVDDNADMREHLGRLLARWWEVETATDGLEALNAARRSPPDLVLTDTMMPRLDGIGLLSALRADPNLAEIPIILLSARAGEEARIEGLDLGADDYLVKPFSARELTTRVRSHLSLSHRRLQATEQARDDIAALTTLQEISTRSLQSLDLQPLLEMTLDAAMSLAQADRGTLQLFNNEKDALEIAAHRAFGRPFLEFFREVRGGGRGATCGAALDRHEAVVVEDVNDSDIFNDTPSLGVLRAAGVLAITSVPLLARTGCFVGMLSVHFSTSRRPSGKVMQRLDVLARQAADFIERTKLLQCLREGESRLQAAVDLVKLGRYAWNPQTNELQCDDRIRAMWGLPAGAPIDYEVWRAGVHPDDLVRVEAAIQECADPRGNGVYDIEYRVIGKTDGVQRWVATRGRTNFKNNVPVSFYAVAMDITDRKLIEEALEGRVEARTHELAEANRKLRAQIEQREIAEAEVQQLLRRDAIGQITSGVAHDFNNLLSVVLTNARLLSHSLRETGDQEGIELIRTAAERGVKLVGQLLAFSRKQRLEPQEVDLNSKIAGMSRLLSATLEGTVQLRTVLAPDLWSAQVDATQVELVILNLVLNARDAMPSGGTLTLETRNAVVDGPVRGADGPSPGQYVGLIVSDTGSGIPDDVLPHVFEPFFTTKQPGRNSGLGLAQLVGFVKQSGGGVGIETRVGKGTSVKVFLPRAEVTRVDHDQMPIVKPGIDTTATILVVDDDAAVLKTTLRLLDSLGYSVVPAPSGEDALQLLDSHSEIDLILADYAMPTMSGIELAKTIRTTRPALPVILVTGYGNREVIEGFGETLILHKPYTEDELILRIKSALNER